MRALYSGLIVLLISASLVHSSPAPVWHESNWMEVVPVEQTSAVWPDAVAVIAGNRLYLLSTTDNNIRWSYSPADEHRTDEKLSPNLLHISDRLIVGSGRVVHVFDRKQIETPPVQVPPPHQDYLERFTELFERATPLLVRNNTAWVKLDSPSVAKRDDGPGILVALQNTPDGFTEQLTGGIVAKALLAASDDLLVTASPYSSQVLVLDATTGNKAWSFLPGAFLQGQAIFAGTKDMLAFGATTDQVISAYSLSDLAKKPYVAAPQRWHVSMKNITTDVLALSDDQAFLVVEAGAYPFAFPRGNDLPPSALVALEAVTGKEKWRAVLIPGDATGMYLPLVDVTEHNGLLLTVSLRDVSGDTTGFIKETRPGIDPAKFAYYLYAVEAKTGKLKWKAPTRGIENLVATTGTTAYLETNKRMLDILQDKTPVSVHAIDLATGAPRWTHENAHLLAATATLAYLQLPDNKIVAVDSVTGKDKYAYNLPVKKLGEGN